MNRRETLKALGIGGLSVSAVLAGCKTGSEKKVDDLRIPMVGRQEFEIERDRQLAKEQFFDAHELATITVLADWIIPKDEKSGSASDAKVTDFIQFIVLDEPEHQLPMRGGLRWLDSYCLSLFDKDFISSTTEEQKSILDEIAFPRKHKPGLESGIAFFNKIRDLTAIGFFTSKMGIQDLGYMGNSPGKWEGVPVEVLKEYGLENV